MSGVRPLPAFGTNAENPRLEDGMAGGAEHEAATPLSCLETPVITSNFSPLVETGIRTTHHAGEISESMRRAREMRSKLLNRLEAEGADDLVTTFRKCGEIFGLTCTSCGKIHDAERRCCKKWCPVCVRRIATQRSLRFEGAVRRMQWPLFLTLTMRNVDDLSFDAVRALRRAFGKLRGRKLWKAHVKAGVASIEVTNTGNGWHPHLHAIIDCEWLAWKTPKPKPRDSRERKAKLCELAAMELERAWAKILRQPTASVKVKRTTDSLVAKEVLKYSVKGSDLIESPDPIAPMIRCLEASRLMTTFGRLFGKAKELADETVKAPLACSCGAVGDWMPTEIVDRLVRKSECQVIRVGRIRS